MIEKITRIRLREAFKHERFDFTKWLQDNLDALNDVTDLALSNAEHDLHDFGTSTSGLHVVWRNIQQGSAYNRGQEIGYRDRPAAAAEPMEPAKAGPNRPRTIERRDLGSTLAPA